MSIRRKPRTYYQQIADAISHEERLEATLVDTLRKHNKVQFIFEHNETKERWRTTLSKLENYKQNGFNHKKGFKDHLPGTLYYLKVAEGKAYKVGITNRSIHDRYYNYDLELIEVIGEITFAYGKDCRDIETQLLNMFNHVKYDGAPLLSSGNSELFCKDILNLDKGEPFAHS